MNWITDLFNWVSKLFQFWVTVLPWERAILVRFGKRQKLLEAGVYVKIPLLDHVFIQSIRLRYMGLPMQTVTTRDGKTISLTASVGYVITDIQKLYNTIYSPSATITNIVMGEISKYCASKDIGDLSPEKIEQECTIRFTDNAYGLGEVSVKVIGYAVVRTYRLIQDHSWFPENENTLSKPTI